MDGDAIYTLWLRDMKWFMRSKVRVASSFAFPVLMLGAIGVGLTAAFPAGFSETGLNYLEFLAPGIVGMTLLFRGTFSGVSVLWDKRFGFMREILIAPVSRLSVMVGKILGGTTESLIAGVIILALSSFMGVSLSGIIGILIALLFMVLISFSFVSLGLAFASLMEDPQTFPLVINLFIMPMLFLSGIFYPIWGAPGWLRTLSYGVPLTYGVDGLRAAIVGVSEFPLWLDFGIIAAFTLAMILLGAYLFNKMSV